MSAPMSFEEWLSRRTLRGSKLYESGASDAWKELKPMIDALKAELAKAREALDIAFAKGVQSALADKAQFKARIAELEQDAARYQFLRSMPDNCDPDRLDVVYWTAADESANDGAAIRGEALDAEIDAALKGQS